jgi:hypothetical protein
LALKIKAEGGQNIQCLLSQASADGEIGGVLAQIKYLPPKISFSLWWDKLRTTIAVGQKAPQGRWTYTKLAFTALPIMSLALWVFLQFPKKSANDTSSDMVSTPPSSAVITQPNLLVTPDVIGDHWPLGRRPRENRGQDERTRAEDERVLEEARRARASAEEELRAIEAETRRYQELTKRAEEEAALYKNILLAKAKVNEVSQQIAKTERARDDAKQELHEILVTSAGFVPITRGTPEPAHHAQFRPSKKITVTAIIVRCESANIEKMTR